jgi:riboflavin transporter FmnP
MNMKNILAIGGLLLVFVVNIMAFLTTKGKSDPGGTFTSLFVSCTWIGCMTFIIKNESDKKNNKGGQP